MQQATLESCWNKNHNNGTDLTRWSDIAGNDDKRKDLENEFRANYWMEKVLPRIYQDGDDYELGTEAIDTNCLWALTVSIRWDHTARLQVRLLVWLPVWLMVTHNT